MYPPFCYLLPLRPVLLYSFYQKKNSDIIFTAQFSGRYQVFSYATKHCVTNDSFFFIIKLEKGDNMKFHERLKQKRIERSLTQDQLAEQLHVTRQAVSNWERGITEPDISTLQSISDCLNWPFSEMMDQQAQKKTMNWKKIMLYSVLVLIGCCVHFTLEPLLKDYATHSFRVREMALYQYFAVTAFYLLIGALFSSFFEHFVPVFTKTATLLLLPAFFYYLYASFYFFFQITLFPSYPILLWIVKNFTSIKNIMFFEGILLNLIFRKKVQK